MKVNKTLGIFLICHLLIWSVLPILLRANLPMDSAEALVWGMIGEWGTNKHPPLSGWLAWIAWFCSGKSPTSLYVLSQLLVCGGLLYIYKLATCFLQKEQALIAAIFMEGIAYYSFVTPEYNCNIVALFLWPACAYYFYQGIKNNRLYDWLIFGFFAGLNVINKYVSGILLFCLGLYLLGTKEGRNILKSWKIYCGAFLSLVIIMPHLVWLYNHDFFVIDYFLGRAGSNNLPYGLGHVVYPLKFLGAQIITALATLLIFAVSYYHRKQKNPVSSNNHKFIFFAGILPLLLMIAIPLISGVKLKSMWGSPVLYMLTIVWFTWLPFNITGIEKKLVITAYVVMFLLCLSYTLQCVSTLSPKFNLKASEFTNDINTNNIKYVGGNIWLASTVGVYGQNNPLVIFEADPEVNPWIDIDDALRQKVLIVEENIDVYNSRRKIFPKLKPAQVYNLQVRNLWGKQKEYHIYYGQSSGDK